MRKTLVGLWHIFSLAVKDGLAGFFRGTERYIFFVKLVSFLIGEKSRWEPRNAGSSKSVRACVIKEGELSIVCDF